MTLIMWGVGEAIVKMAKRHGQASWIGEIHPCLTKAQNIKPTATPIGK
jgi:hypothetical protein